MSRLVLRLGFKTKARQAASVNFEHIQKEERYAIAAMRTQNVRIGEIARRLGRHRSTIYRELRRNASAHDGHYRASHAVQKASGRQKRSKRNMRYSRPQFRMIETSVPDD